MEILASAHVHSHLHEPLLSPSIIVALLSSPFLPHFCVLSICRSFAIDILYVMPHDNPHEQVLSINTTGTTGMSS